MDPYNPFDDEELEGYPVYLPEWLAFTILGFAIFGFADFIVLLVKWCGF